MRGMIDNHLPSSGQQGGGGSGQPGQMAGGDPAFHRQQEEDLAFDLGQGLEISLAL